jgi:hypothetical protein
MEIVTVNPAISPFQQALLDGVRRGVLADGDVERIRREGAVLVQKTAERFFTDSAREESYLYAVRMVDVLLSFELARYPDPTEQVTGSPLNGILKNALSVLRKSNGWPSGAYLPSVPGPEIIAECVVPNIRKSSLTSNERLALLVHEYSQRHENEATVRLATYFVSLQNSKQEFVMDPCDDIIASHLFSVVYGLEQGYCLTLSDLHAISRRKRPTIERVQSILDQYRATIPKEYLVAYDSAIHRFFGKSDVLRFFGNKGCSVNVFLGEYGGIYYVGSHARPEVPILDQNPD